MAINGNNGCGRPSGGIARFLRKFPSWDTWPLEKWWVGMETSLGKPSGESVTHQNTIPSSAGTIERSHRWPLWKLSKRKFKRKIKQPPRRCQDARDINLTGLCSWNGYYSCKHCDIVSKWENLIDLWRFEPNEKVDCPMTLRFLNARKDRKTFTMSYRSSNLPRDVTIALINAESIWQLTKWRSIVMDVLEWTVEWSPISKGQRRPFSKTRTNVWNGVPSITNVIASMRKRTNFRKCTFRLIAQWFSTS